jgi:hypothetical protein
MVMQANILYSPASGANRATGGGSMETQGRHLTRASVPVIISTAHPYKQNAYLHL